LQDASVYLANNSLSIQLVDNPYENPLFRATAMVNDEIKATPEESKENENQLVVLDTKHPFIKIFVRHD